MYRVGEVGGGAGEEDARAVGRNASCTRGRAVRVRAR